MPRGETGKKNLKPTKKGEVRNIYGQKGKPENREEIQRKKMEKKIIKDAVMKELGSIVPGSDLTVLEHLVKRTIQNAAGGNDRLFNKLVDMIDGPITQKLEQHNTGNGLGVIILPDKDVQIEENE